MIDLFIDNPDLYARSMEISATNEAVWGIEKIVGPAAVLDEVKDALERVADSPGTTGMCGVPVTDVERLGTPPCLLEGGRVQQTLTPEQKAALEAAIKRGYYEEPRQQSVAEIAEDAGVSRSTFQYRLNRPEAWLAQQFAADSLTVDLDVDLDPEDIEFIQ